MVPGKDVFHFPATTILGVRIPFDSVAPLNFYLERSRKTGLFELRNVWIIPPNVSPVCIYFDFVLIGVSSMNVADKGSHKHRVTQGPSMPNDNPLLNHACVTP